MDKDYINGFNDAVELLEEEIGKIFKKIRVAVKENKIEKLKKELGLF